MTNIEDRDIIVSIAYATQLYEVPNVFDFLCYEFKVENDVMIEIWKGLIEKGLLMQDPISGACAMTEAGYNLLVKDK